MNHSYRRDPEWLNLSNFMGNKKVKKKSKSLEHANLVEIPKKKLSVMETVVKIVAEATVKPAPTTQKLEPISESKK